jgi:phosphatidylserine/phosphatidylglycerophosphate/cardiolipin synthase-like enzyme
MVETVIIKRELPHRTDVDEAKHYFGQAVEDASPATPRITVHGFPQRVPQNGVLHCKMVITDEKRAVVVGSPFSQRYYDFYNHRIDDPHRGANTNDMVHDLSIAVKGPAVQDLYETFRVLWNEDIPVPEELPEAPVPAAITGGDDPVAKVQVVRTLSGNRFKKRFAGLNGKSEKGILEAYLRAFAAANNYIYLENQYFTDSVITDALCEVLRKKPTLQLILVVPIKPDIIFYPRRAAARIQQLREAGGDRVGVFTRWTYNHNVPAGARPWVAPVYIHAKGAVVDDSWATVGSANLDGLSLDYNLLLSPLVFGEMMAAELNVNVIPPQPGQITPFAELMRRRLFAEHLGLVDALDKPDPGHGGLDAPPVGGWLGGLWRPMAAEALRHVVEARHEKLPGFVLEYPAEDGGWLDRPRKHLKALGVDAAPAPRGRIRAVTGTRGFDFGTGMWNVMPELEDTK